MKNSTLSLLLLFFLTSAYGQTFEGEIIYSNHFVSKMKNFTDQQLEVMIGTKQEYLISGGSYKSFLNGQSVVMQQYDYKTNRMYNRKVQSDTLYWFDASVNTDDVVSYEIKKNAEVILGNQCDAIVMKTKTGTTTMYYSAKYKVDSNVYRQHNYGNWAFYAAKTGALPLKTIMETSAFKMESVATVIKPMKLGEDYFKIDSKTPIKKS
ncbi:MAG: hypothetical protein HUM72_24320 [Dolichospermum sp.]|nr:hypothetical protein [Dolichospermum sp.]